MKYRKYNFQKNKFHFPVPIFAAVNKKYRSRSGETITEVLVASLVISLGSILLASMVTASTKIIQKSITAYQQYMGIHNTAEMLTKDGLSSAISVTLPDGSSMTIESSSENTDGTASLSGNIRSNALSSDPSGNAVYNNTGTSLSADETEPVKVYSVTEQDSNDSDENASKYSLSRYFPVEETVAHDGN